MPIAFTGKKGAEATALTASTATSAAGCEEGEVFLASTGVIGEPLDASKFSGVLSAMATEAKPDLWLDRRQSHHDHGHLPEGGYAGCDN